MFIDVKDHGEKHLHRRCQVDSVSEPLASVKNGSKTLSIHSIKKTRGVPAWCLWIGASYISYRLCRTPVNRKVLMTPNHPTEIAFALSSHDIASKAAVKATLTPCGQRNIHGQAL